MHIEPKEATTVSPRHALLAAVAFALAVSGCAHKAPPPPVAVAPAPTATKAAQAAPAPIIEQQALDHLKAMSDTLAAAKSFTYRARSAVEVPAKTGQFLTHFIESEVALDRPNKLRSQVTGDLPHFQVYYDGATVSALDVQDNLYATAKAPATVDELLPFALEKAGIDFPAADLLTANPYAELTKGMTHAIAVGSAKVAGVVCEHFAYMTPVANWEIWIDADSLPRRLATTYKSIANFPRFQTEFLDWKLNPKLDTGQFVFKKPQGAKEIEFGVKVDNPPQ